MYSHCYSKTISDEFFSVIIILSFEYVYNIRFSSFPTYYYVRRYIRKLPSRTCTHCSVLLFSFRLDFSFYFPIGLKNYSHIKHTIILLVLPSIRFSSLTSITQRPREYNMKLPRQRVYTQ